MAGKRFNTFLNIVLVIVILLILVSIGFIGYEYFYKKYKNATDAQNEIEKIDQYIAENNNLVVEVSNEPVEESDKTKDTNVTTRTYNPNTNYGLTYRGYGVLGKIELPKVGLMYPVLETMTDAKSIDISVAMQYGVGLNNIGNTVIIGHNYRNGTFFGSNKKLVEGDKVYITDLSGNKVEYTIYSKYLTPQEDYSYAQRDTGGKREITLVTCHSNNKYRLILCAREQ
ncbi:MAG: sortase [Clostridia bacterium]|nr:sortase [Clostridia bacterium]